MDINDEMGKKSVFVTDFPPGTKKDELFIYFQKERNGGGEVVDVKMVDEGKAVVVFDKEEVAQRVLTRPRHKYKDTLLHLEPYGSTACNTDLDDIQVFTLVSAKLDPSLFTDSAKKIDDLLVEAKPETGADFLKTCDGYLVSGTLRQLDNLSLFLSKYAKSPRAKHSSDDTRNAQQNGHPYIESNDEERNDLKPMELSVEPKLMRILQKEVQAIENKYKIKIRSSKTTNKAELRPIGADAKLFHEGVDAFISLYQKEFQDLEEKEFSLDSVNSIADVDNMIKTFMEEFSVVIERNQDKNIHIFGKEDHVFKVIKEFQSKFGKRRGRRAHKGQDSAELPMLNIDAQASMLPLSQTLNNGVVVSVHQGDITKLRVDVIVNAANENLDHGGGVAGAIVKQGGPQIQRESKALIWQYGPVRVGQVVWTGPGSLHCKRIFHAVGPQWKVHGEAQSRQFIYEACLHSIVLAYNQGFYSIALPGISSGLYGVPKQICAEMMFTAAEVFSCDLPKDNQLKDIRFINIDAQTSEVFRREFLNRYGTNKSLGKDSSRDPPHTHEIDQKEREKQRNQTGQDKARQNEVSERQKREEATMQRVKQKEEKSANEIKPNDYKDMSEYAFTKGFNKHEENKRADVSRLKKNEENNRTQKENRGTKKKGNEEIMSMQERNASVDGKEADPPNNINEDSPKNVREKDNDQERQSLEQNGAGFLKEGFQKRDETRTRILGEKVQNEEKLPTTKDLGAQRSVNPIEPTREHHVRNNEQHYPYKFLKTAGRGRGALLAAVWESVLTSDEVRKPPGLCVTKEGLELVGKCQENIGAKENTNKKKYFDSEVPGNADAVPCKRSKRLDKNEKTTENIVQKHEEQESGKSESGEFESRLHESDESKSVKHKTGEQEPGERDPAAQESDELEPVNLKIGEQEPGGWEPGEQESGEHKSDEKEFGENKFGEEEPGEQLESSGQESDKQESVKQKNGEQEHDEQEPGAQESGKQESDEAESVRHKTGEWESGKQESDEQEPGEQEPDEQEPGVQELGEQEPDELEPVNLKIGEQELGEREPGAQESGKQESDEQEPGEQEPDEQELGEREPGGRELVEQESSEHKSDEKEFGENKFGEKEPGEQLESSAQGCGKQEAKSFKHKAGAKEYGKQKYEQERDQASPAEGTETKKASDPNIKAKGFISGAEDTDAKIYLYADKNSASGAERERNEFTYSDVHNLNTYASSKHPSMGSFEILSIPKENHDSSSIAGSASGSSEGSSESIIILGNQDTLPGNPLNKLGVQLSCDDVNNHIRMQDAESSNKSDENDLKNEKVARHFTESENKGIVEVTRSTEDPASGDGMAGALEKNDSSGGSTFIATGNNNQECGVCFGEIQSHQALRICDSGHMVCVKCFQHFQRNENKSVCPTCHRDIARIVLQPPNGQIKSCVMEGNLPGYEGCPTIYIDYELPGGIQGPFHPNPGSPFDKLSRRTFLPDNQEGREVMELFHKAFEAGVLFTTGKSTINGKDNQIIFTPGIEHKYNIEGGILSNGYPDPEYLVRVKAQLKDMGIE